MDHDLASSTPDAPGAGGPGSARVRRGAARVLPERGADHAHLSLAQLRDLRRALQSEEDRVSYWRRILQARLDVVRDGDLRTGTRLDPDHLRPVLTGARVGSGRRALVEVLAVHDIPPLPDLAQLWERRVRPGDVQAQQELQRDLVAAEQQLSAYRSVLHERQGAATGELIARYREQPGLCLSVLPSRTAAGA